MPTKTQIYQIKITLQGIEPPPDWRIQVRSNTPLDRLHDIIQVVMGWTKSTQHCVGEGGRDTGG